MCLHLFSGQSLYLWTTDSVDNGTHASKQFPNVVEPESL